MNKMERIRIAKIINTHGIKGECKITMFDDFETKCFECGKPLSLTNGKVNVDVTPMRLRMHKGFPLVVFKEITNMSEAEKYKEYLIEMELDDLPEKNDGTYYHFELIGLEVVDQDGNKIGVVKNIEKTLANEIVRVEREDMKDALVPYVDAFILDIDMEKEIMQINVIEGLL